MRVRRRVMDNENECIETETSHGTNYANKRFYISFWFNEAIEGKTRSNYVTRLEDD